MLVLMAALWQVGWAADSFKTLVRDGITYYYGESAKYASKYGKNIALVGTELKKFSLKGYGDYYLNVLPSQKTIKILSDITVDGTTYPVVAFYDGKDYYDDVSFDESVVDDIYFTRFYPSYVSHTDYDLSPTVDWRVCPRTVVHVPENLMDEVMKKSDVYFRVTDGNRWYQNSVSEEYNQTYPAQMKVGKALYNLYYPASQSRSADCVFDSYVSEATVPASVNDGYAALPVTAVNLKFGFGTPVDLHIQSLVDIKTYSGNNLSLLTVHVPSSIYEAALEKYGKTMTVTDGQHTGGNIQNFTKTITDDAGFTFNVTYKDGVCSAELTKLPDTETVIIPEKVVYMALDFPVTAVSFTQCGSNVKDIYFGNILPSLFTGENVTAHVADSQFDTALTSLTVKAVLSDSHKALSKDIFSFSYVSSDNTPQSMLYDADGDGRLDFFSACFQGYWIDGTAQYFGMTKAVSIDGDEVFLSTKTIPYCPIPTSGHFAQFSRDGKPYWVDRTGLVFDMEGDLALDRHITENYTSRLVATADINGDGCKEILHTSLWRDGYYNITRMLPDGTFVDDKIYVTSDTMALSSIDDYTPNSGVITKSTGGGGGITGLGVGMFVKAKQNPLLGDMADDSADDATATGSAQSKRLVKEGNQLRMVTLPTGALSASDYNGDGLIDLNDGENIYYNLGGNRFFRSPHKGTVYAADLTGNGLLDFIDFTSTQTDLYITRADGSMGEPKTLLKNQAVQNVFFGDFDRDGDVDILFFIKGTDYTLFQFYRNEGNGTFSAKDDNVDGLYTATACNDYDGDGLYEILACQYDKDNRYITGYYLFKIGKSWSVSKTDLPDSFVMVGDLDNDGVMDMLSRNTYTNQWGSTSTGNYTLIDKIPGAVKNTRPEKMSKPSAVAFADANKLKISWAQGKDSETSACDLTYELRIGTASGKGDIYYGNANADGTRRVLADGNMGRALSYMYDTGNLTEGKYYIALQAVDASGLGGAWSDELVYDHKLSAPVITSLVDNAYCTADTVALAVQNPVAAAAYEWTVDDADIIGQNDNASMVKVRFREAGKRTFSVSMTLGGNTLQSAKETVIVAPSKGVTLVAADGKNINSKYLVDIDQDGNAEIAATDSWGNSLSSFYERKSDGTYSSIRKTWNTDITGDFFFSDFNRDGYPDFVTSYNSTVKVFYNSGEQDKAFDIEEVTAKDIPDYVSYIMDWNNDGKFALNGDEVDKDGSFSFTDLKIAEDSNSGYGLSCFYDFNRDGNMDIWKNERDYTALKDQTKVRLKVPGGDMQFDTDAKVFYENKHSYTMSGFADFNNDGNADGYYFDNGYMVIVKGKSMSEWPCTETVAIPIDYESYTKVTLLDIDNNGYLDILYGGSVWLMDKDFKYTKMPYGPGSAYYNEYHWQPLTPGGYPNGLASAIANEAPAVPANVTAQNTAAGLLLKWDDSTDDRTPWAQMRYNVSLKVKGKTGAGAFVLSPMNGLSDEAAILSGVYYRKATQLTVPASALTEGVTYEVQVQAIDLMGEHSAMSKPVDVVFHKEGFIAASMPSMFTDVPVTLSYPGQHKTKVTCNPGEGGTVVDADGDNATFSVKWATPGLKTVTMNVDGKTVEATYNVALMPSLKVELPEKVMLNTELTVKVPEAFFQPGFEKCRFTDPWGNCNEACTVTYTPGDSTATLMFTELGESYVKTSVRVPGAVRDPETNSTTTVVDQVMPEARIASVESDGSRYRVNWSTDVPAMVNKVEIARETNRLGQFETLDVVPVANATWCDPTSDNRIQPQRYRLRLLADNGVQTSGWSEAHNPLHVDINKTADGHGNNLMWNAYEGLDVESYTILRGTTAGKLQPVATVPSTQLSYTDSDAPDATCYYAVRFNQVRTMNCMGVMCVQQLDEKVQSNVISSTEAMPTIAATGISVVAVENTVALAANQPVLHLAAVILPTFATYNKVGWAIVSGGGLATIASNGVLTATGGKGEVVVRATTLDGSNLSADITVPCDYAVLAKSIGIFKPKSSLLVGESMQLEAVILPRNVSSKDVTWKSLDEEIATIDASGVVKAVASGTARIQVQANDGTGVYAFAYVSIVEPTAIGRVTADGDADLQYFTLDGKKIEKPVRGQVYVTSKGVKMVFK